MRVALYLRVSTSDQLTDNQRIELEKVARQRDWNITAIYEDVGVSGAKGRDQRPELDKLLSDATRGRFDIIMSWSVDRLGRSMQHLVTLLSDIQSIGVDLYLHQQAVDTSTPSGKALFQMCGVFAEFERSMIQERVKAGLERAKASGKRLGRKPVGADKERLVLTLRKQGLGIKKIAREAGVGVSVVQRLVKQVAA